MHTQISNKHTHISDYNFLTTEEKELEIAFLMEKLSSDIVDMLALLQLLDMQNLIIRIPFHI